MFQQFFMMMTAAFSAATKFFVGTDRMMDGYVSCGNIVASRAESLEAEYVSEAKIKRAELEAKYSTALKQLESK